MLQRSLLVIPAIFFAIGTAGDQIPFGAPIDTNPAPIIDVMPMGSRPSFGDDDAGPRTKRVRPGRLMGEWEDIVDADAANQVTTDLVLWS